MDHEHKHRDQQQQESDSHGCCHGNSQHHRHGGHSCGMGSPWFLILIGAGFLLFYFFGK